MEHLYIVKICKHQSWNESEAVTYLFPEFEEATAFVKLSLENLLLVQIERKKLV